LERERQAVCHERRRRGPLMVRGKRRLDEKISGKLGLLVS
jgi:hypothetical protein